MIDVIGAVRFQELQSDPEVEPITHTRDGFFVNATERLDDLDIYMPEDESHIPKIFGATTYHYQFSSEEQARAVLGYWYPSEENEVYQARYHKVDKRRQALKADFKAQRQALEIMPINGIAVAKDSHRADVEKFAESLELYPTLSEEEQAEYADLINEDGTVNWTLDDDTSRAVSAEELRATIRQFWLRKARLMKVYQVALKELDDIDCFDVNAIDQIESVTLEF